MEYGPILIYKNIGETPLEALNRLKIDHREWADLPMTYAGRLDPLAEGLMVALVGEDCKKKDEYLGLDKEYELSVLFGVGTDTYDLLGMVLNSPLEEYPKGEVDEPFPPRPLITESTPQEGNKISGFATVFKNFIGDINQSYPLYSSKPVDGRPLFQISRDGDIGGIEIPSHVVNIKSIEILEYKNITKEDLLSYIEGVVSSVGGDFRQKEILDKWREVLHGADCPDYFPILSLRVSCGSGTYMRTLAHDLGVAIGAPALAFHIRRTRVGDYSLDDVK